jgi:hypothetical protein
MTRKRRSIGSLQGIRLIRSCPNIMTKD